MEISTVNNKSTGVQVGSYKTSLIVTYSLIASMGGLMFGFDLGILGGAVPFLKEHFKIDGLVLGLVAAIFEVGAMVGTFVTSYIADKFGRKKSLQFAAVSFVLSSILVAFSHSTFELTFWRFVQGVGVGAASVLSPMYIAEISPAKIRGKLVAFNQLSIVLGILLASISNFYYGDPNDAESWRWMFGSALLPSVLFLVGLFVIPESPRWLMKMSKKETATSVLKKIGDADYLNNEINEIEKSFSQVETSSSVSELFGKKVLPVLMIGFGLAILQQLCGINNVFTYLQEIFKKAHIEIKSGLLNAVWVMLVFFVFTILSLVLVDKLGRKKLMLWGTGLMAFFLFMLAFSFYASDVNPTWILIFVMGYIATFAFTLGPVVWVLLSEIFPNYVRAKALSYSSAVLWLTTSLVVLVSPIILEYSVVLNFVLFGVFNFLGVLFVWKYVPETKGKSLEEIEKMLFENQES
jgi:MFS transporter, SP family, arabinose:H+ symporter